PFTIDSADGDETPHQDEDAGEMVARLARSKTMAGAARRPDARVLGADTTVEVDGVLLGKPADDGEAATMLGRLAGREHRVSPGLGVVPPGGTARGGGG